MDLCLGSMKRCLSNHANIASRFLYGYNVRTLNEGCYVDNEVIEKILAIIINNGKVNNYIVLNSIQAVNLIRRSHAIESLPPTEKTWVFAYQKLIGEICKCSERCQFCFLPEHCLCDDQCECRRCKGNPRHCSHRGTHWILFLINFQEKQFRILDSLEKEPHIQQKLLIMCTILRILNINNEGWSVDTPIHDTQSDGYNCGVYVCKYFANIVSGAPLTDINIGEARSELRRLLLKSIDEEKFWYCGAENNKTKDCSICGRIICERCVTSDSHLLTTSRICEICNFHK